MSGPLIPFIDGEKLELPLPFVKDLLHAVLGDMVDPSTPASIKPFGTLVALGVYIGAMVTLRRTRERKLNARVMNDFIFWVVAIGFVLSHMLDAIAYHPEVVWRDPLYLLKIWAGLSSYGGFIGAAIGAVAWRYYRRQPILEYIDLCVSAFPLAWVFGRSGCSLVHDHPGAVSDAWFAVQYPNTVCPAGFAPDAVCGRYDLGLIEMVLTIPLALACIWLWRRKPLRASGFYIGLTLTAYAPVRFLLDFLRVDPSHAVFRGATDPRYWGLTPAQWVCFLALFVGVYFLRKTWNAPYVRTALARGESLPGLEADTDADDAGDGDADSDADAADARAERVKRRASSARKRSKARKNKRADTDGDASESASSDASEGDSSDAAEGDSDDSDDEPSADEPSAATKSDAASTAAGKTDGNMPAKPRRKRRAKKSAKAAKQAAADKADKSG